MSLLPRTPLSLFLLSLSTACPLPETPQLTEPTQSWKKKAKLEFLMCSGLSYKDKAGSSQETTESCAKKKVDGQRLCQTNSCCCSCWMYLPNKSWSIRESHLQQFSGIYVPGRSSGQGVEPQDVTETNCDYSEFIRLGEQGINIIPWKSVQQWLRHCKSHMGDSAPSPFHFLLENQPSQHLREMDQPKMRETKRKRAPGKQGTHGAEPSQTFTPSRCPARVKQQEEQQDYGKHGRKSSCSCLSLLSQLPLAAPPRPAGNQELLFDVRNKRSLLTLRN